jgi:hypothetical protein
MSTFVRTQDGNLIFIYHLDKEEEDSTASIPNDKLNNVEFKPYIRTILKWDAGKTLFRVWSNTKDRSFVGSPYLLLALIDNPACLPCVRCKVNAGIMWCTDCRQARYCSKQCMDDDWFAIHSSICNTPLVPCYYVESATQVGGLRWLIREKYMSNWVVLEECPQRLRNIANGHIARSS